MLRSDSESSETQNSQQKRKFERVLCYEHSRSLLDPKKKKKKAM